LAKFLEQVADFILEKVGDDTLHTAVIFPNKRSEIFLKNHLRNKVKSNYWLPEFFTIDEFMVNGSGMVELEPVNIYFELFKVHKTIAGEDARGLDDFLAWAPVMLADFTDIDLYLADAKAVFTNLSEVKAIEQWNPSGRALTDLQKHYLSFYNSLHQYYTHLKSNLKEKGLGYKGMIYRYLFENIETVSKAWPWQRFILVGFNALSKAEKKVFGYLKREFQVDVLFDIDEYYFSSDRLSNKEAGRFIRDLIKEWNINEINWTTNLLSKDKKEINVLGVPKRIGQVKYAAQLIEEWSNRQQFEREMETHVFLDTAIVLGDESLLVPFLNSLPQAENKKGEKIPFNITMGYPLMNSPIALFVLSWIELLQSKQNIQGNKYSIRHVLNLLYNPFFSLIIDNYTDNKTHKITGKLLDKNNLFLSREELMAISCDDYPQLRPVFDLILQPPGKADGFIDLFIGFLALIKSTIAETYAPAQLLKEQMIMITSLIKKLKVLISEVSPDLSYRALEKVFIQLVNRSEISLKGEPLSGIQVMGMLETRNLDFKNLIILSVNDGILPKTDNIESFIPFDIRRHYNLPLPNDKSDIYAYHFYRLLQRAETVNLVYNSESDAFGGGEKSRFILQLEEELQKVNPLLDLQLSQIKVPMGKPAEKQIISINKTDEILDVVNKRLKKGLSPTALSAFINCPLKYYFRYVINLKPPESQDSDIEANVFGRVVHGVLEDLYKDFEGKPIEINKLKITDEVLRQQVNNKFRVEFVGGNLTSGQNLLKVEVVNQYLKRYFKTEIRELTKQNRILLSAEEELTTTIELAGKEIKLRGTIDRTDKSINTGTIRIVDYKTGAVKPGDLKVKEWESLINNPDTTKAFQVLYYAYLFIKNKIVPKNIEAGIISMRNISNVFMKLQLPENALLIDSTANFEELLDQLVNRIIDPLVPLIQTEDEERCLYCDYKNICNRNPKSSY